jgi:hypothetical protein
MRNALEGGLQSLRLERPRNPYSMRAISKRKPAGDTLGDRVDARIDRLPEWAKPIVFGPEEINAVLERAGQPPIGEEDLAPLRAA